MTGNLPLVWSSAAITSKPNNRVVQSLSWGEGNNVHPTLIFQATQSRLQQQSPRCRARTFGACVQLTSTSSVSERLSVPPAEQSEWHVIDSRFVEELLGPRRAGVWSNQSTCFRQHGNRLCQGRFWHPLLSPWRPYGFGPSVWSFASPADCRSAGKVTTRHL